MNHPMGEIENVVLGGAMVNPSRAAQVAGLTQDHFRFENSREIHSAILRLYAAKKPVDERTVATVLDANFVSIERDEIATLSAIGTRTTDETFEGYVAILKEEGDKQMLAAIGRRLAQDAVSGPSLESAREEALESLQQVSAAAAGASPSHRISSVEEVPSIWDQNDTIDWLIDDFLAQAQLRTYNERVGGTHYKL